MLMLERPLSHYWTSPLSRSAHYVRMYKSKTESACAWCVLCISQQYVRGTLSTPPVAPPAPWCVVSLSHSSAPTSVSLAVPAHLACIWRHWAAQHVWQKRIVLLHVSFFSYVLRTLDMVLVLLCFYLSIDLLLLFYFYLFIIIIFFFFFFFFFGGVGCLCPQKMWESFCFGVVLPCMCLYTPDLVNTI